MLDSIKNATNFSDGNENIKPKIQSSNITNSTDSINDGQRLSTTVKFSVPVLEINLQNESHEPLVNVTFKDFFVKHRVRGNEEDVKVILNSVLMEDLKSDLSSPFRNMVTSINLENSYRKKKQSSSSCPDLPSFCSKHRSISTSVPTNLCEYIKLKNNEKQLKSKLCSKKDLSDQKKHNLVIYRSHSKRLLQQTSETKIESQNSIEFNCLNLTICVDRWYTIFDFFGLVTETEKPHHLVEQKDIIPESK